MNGTMRPGTGACGAGPHRIARRRKPPGLAHLIDTDLEATSADEPPIDPLDDREGRGR